MEVLYLWLSSPVLAGQLRISAPDPVVVVLDGQVAGTTPLSLNDLEGSHALAFRRLGEGEDAANRTVHIPSDGVVSVIVDLSAGQIEVSGEAQRGAPADDAGPTGDLFIGIDEAPEDAVVLLDGQVVDVELPGLLAGVSAGPHVVGVRSACSRASADVTIAESRITRVDLTLEAGRGELTVASEPKGATVLVDGVEVGAAPLSLPLDCGAHELAVRTEGFRDHTQPVDVRAFEGVEVAAVLEPEAYGTLVINPTPVDATVSVDGVEVAVGPTTLEPVVSGPHTVLVAAKGFESAAHEVEVQKDAVARLDVALEARERRAGRLVLNSGVTVAGLGLGAAAGVQYAQARREFAVYLDTKSNDAAAALYEDEVLPAKRAAVGLGAASGALLVASTALWVTTDLGVAAGPSTVVLMGRF